MGGVQLDLEAADGKLRAGADRARLLRVADEGDRARQLEPADRLDRRPPVEVLGELLARIDRSGRAGVRRLEAGEREAGLERQRRAQLERDAVGAFAGEGKVALLHL